MTKFISEPIRLSGPTLFLTSTGYFKNAWVVLTGNELFFYQSKNDTAFSKMVIVQGASIHCTLADKPLRFADRTSYRELYKIEIALTNQNPVTLYLQKHESLIKWHNALVSGSGDYKIEDYYDQFPNVILGTNSDFVIYKGISKQFKHVVAIKKIKKNKNQDFY